MDFSYERFLHHHFSMDAMDTSFDPIDHRLSTDRHRPIDVPTYRRTDDGLYPLPLASPPTPSHQGGIPEHRPGEPTSTGDSALETPVCQAARRFGDSIDLEPWGEQKPTGPQGGHHLKTTLFLNEQR